MGNPNENSSDEDDDHIISPDELVLEAVASSSIDPEKAREKTDAEAAAIESVIAQNQEDLSEKHGSDDPNKKGGVHFSELADADVEAALPPNLERATARSSTQPGAYRAGTSDMRMAAENGGVQRSVSASAASTTTATTSAATARDTLDSTVGAVARSNNEEPQGTTIKHLVEATLVDEHAPSAHQQQQQSNEPVYKAQAVDDDDTIPSGRWQGRKLVWFGILCVLFTVTVITVTVAVTLTQLRKPKPPRGGNSSDDLDQEMDESTLDAGNSLNLYPRVTSHLAYLYFVAPEGCALSNDRSTIEVRLDCEADLTNFSPSEVDHFLTPSIKMWNKSSNCQRESPSAMKCEVELDKASRFYFSCGTDSSLYATGSNRTTARMGVEDPLTLDCAFNSQLRPELASFATVGRFCSETQGLDKIFRSEIECSKNSRDTRSDLVEEFNYCLQEEVQQCNSTGESCLVEFGEVSAKDQITSEDCQFENEKYSEESPLDRVKEIVFEAADEFVKEWRDAHGYPGTAL